jgi:hypothetical protein
MREKAMVKERKKHARKGGEGFGREVVRGNSYTVCSFPSMFYKTNA